MSAVEVVVDTIMGYWLSATHRNEDLREWWESDDSAETARELAVLIVDALGVER